MGSALGFDLTGDGPEDILLVHAGRKIVVRANTSTGDRHQRSMIHRGLGFVLLSRDELEFPLPPRAAGSPLRELELQLWVPERLGRVSAKVRVLRDAQASAAEQSQ